MDIEKRKERQKRYSQKCLTFALNYYINDNYVGECLKHYLETTNQSANSYLKKLVFDDLTKKGLLTE